MPIYEYQCPTCDHRFEQMVKMDAPTPACPECAGTEVKKLVSASAFILQGGGWYKDHYGLKSGGGAKSDGGGAKSDGGAKADGGAKTESKAADKAPAKTESAPKATPAAK